MRFRNAGVAINCVSDLHDYLRRLWLRQVDLSPPGEWVAGIGGLLALVLTATHFSVSFGVSFMALFGAEEMGL